jgi:hypothetical protein
MALQSDASFPLCMQSAYRHCMLLDISQISRTFHSDRGVWRSADRDIFARKVNPQNLMRVMPPEEVENSFSALNRACLGLRGFLILSTALPP